MSEVVFGQWQYLDGDGEPCEMGDAKFAYLMAGDSSFHIELSVEYVNYVYWDTLVERWEWQVINPETGDKVNRLACGYGGCLEGGKLDSLAYLATFLERLAQSAGLQAWDITPY